MKKICHITSVHPPFDIRIFHKECKTLANRGYKVVLIVSHDKGGEIEGILVRPIPEAKNRLERMTKIQWKIYKVAKKEGADLYHFHDLELILVGLLLKICGKKVVYDVHEDYSKALLSREWIPLRFRWLVTRLVVLIEKIGIKYFDGIVAATPEITKRFPSSKAITVQNFPFLNEGIRHSHIPYQRREKMIAYIGVISSLRGAKEMIKAMALLPSHLDAKLKLIGAFSPLSLERDVEKFSGWDRVEFIGWQTHRDTIEMLGKARAGLVLFLPAPNHMAAQPNKLFEYMSVGIPVIASDFPLWRKVVDENKCGLLVNPLHPEAIAKAIQWILEHPFEAEIMGKEGQKVIRLYYHWEKEAEKLLNFYHYLLPNASSLCP
jgi:glycosyltransferase involved in cell wall biosynthesis